MYKVRRFSKKDLSTIILLQKIENNACEAKKEHRWEDAERLLEKWISGCKSLLADNDLPEYTDTDSIKKENTNPDVKFETDDLTKKILNKYFGINIKKEDK